MFQENEIGKRICEGGYYSIRVAGELDPGWAGWFNGLAIAHDPDGNTTISGVVADQAALYGILGRLRDLGLALLSVNGNTD